MKLVLYSLFLFTSWNTYSKNRAVITEEELSLLNEYKESYVVEPVKKQCHGICYIESVIQLLEDRISSEVGYDVEVDMVDFLSRFSRRRVKEKYLEPLFSSDRGEVLKKISYHGYILFYKGGDEIETIDFLYRNGVRYKKRGTVKQRFLDRKKVKNFFFQVQRLFREVHLENRKNEKEMMEFISTGLKNGLQKAIEEMSNLESPNEKVQKIIESKLEKMKEIQNLPFKRYSHFFQALEEVQRGTYFVSSFFRLRGREDVAKTNKILKNVQKDFENVRERLEKERLKIEKKTLVGLNKICDEIKGKEEVGNKGRSVLISHETDRGFTRIYDYETILNFIDKNNPAILSLRFYQNTEHTFSRESGIISIGERGEKKSLGNHSVKAIDTIKNERGEVVFVVIKNSWGLSSGYRGLNFIHHSMFLSIEEMTVPHFRKSRILQNNCFNRMRLFTSSKMSALLY